MLRVGLTGGLASGKSLVGHALADLGCHLIEADALGHEVMLPGGDAYAPVVSEFGAEILDTTGAIDRRCLGALVFGHPERLAKLSSYVHPAVVRREEQIMAGIQASDPQGIVVVEAAILVETGSYRRFARVIVAVCSREMQIARAMKRDGLTREEVLARLERQLPLEEKVKVADYVIDTSGTKEHALEQTREVYRSLRSLQP
jgi:dephospho-CoA kinase